MRLDHSHTWIKPRLQQGTLVISDRNIHSSLVYQGYVGKLGIERVAKMNAAALIPDLVFGLIAIPKSNEKNSNRNFENVKFWKTRYILKPQTYKS